jgi:hypothetical protein
MARLVFKAENNSFPSFPPNNPSGNAASAVFRSAASCGIGRTRTEVKVACRLWAVVPGVAANNRNSTGGEMRSVPVLTQMTSGRGRWRGALPLFVSAVQCFGGRRWPGCCGD